MPVVQVPAIVSEEALLLSGFVEGEVSTMAAGVALFRIHWNAVEPDAFPAASVCLSE